jgi:hypothetical protein
MRHSGTLPELFSDLPPYATFSDGDLPLAYRDPYEQAKAIREEEAQPTLAPLAGVRVFSLNNATDLSDLKAIVQQIAWGYGKFDLFQVQYEQTVFRVLAIWTLYQRMPATAVSGMKKRAWDTIRQIHVGARNDR